MSGNEDGDAGTPFPRACMGYCYYFGGGKLSSPTVLLLQHDGALACSEWEAPCHCSVRQGVGKEVKAASRGRTVGELREGFSGLRGTIGDRGVVKIYGKAVDGRG